MFFLIHNIVFHKFVFHNIVNHVNPNKLRLPQPCDSLIQHSAFFIQHSYLNAFSLSPWPERAKSFM